MAVDTLVIPKPVYHLLRQLTGEARPDVALSLAIKDLVRLRLDQARTTISAFEAKYALTFDQFSEKWQAGEIPQAFSYPVEQDYWTWEAAVADLHLLQELSETLV